MAKIQQSVNINVPANIAYNQLTQFEDYPRFMNEVESAQQIDDTHVRWTTRIGQHAHTWNSEIVEQQPDQCIAWRNVDGPINTGRIDVEALDVGSARVTFTLESNAVQTASEGELAMTRQIEANLQQLKQLLESQGKETGAWRGEIRGGQVTTPPATTVHSEKSPSHAAGQGSRDGAQLNGLKEGDISQQSEPVRHTGNLPHQSAEGYGDMGMSGQNGEQKQ